MKSSLNKHFKHIHELRRKGVEKMRNSEEDEDPGLEKYVKYSIEDLTALKESYRMKINSKVEKHWLTKLETRTKHDVGKILHTLSLLLIIIPAIILMGMASLMVFSGEFAYNLFFSLMIPLIVPVFLGSTLIELMDDKTGNLRREYRNMNLVLINKQISPNKRIMLDSNIIDEIAIGNITTRDFEEAKKRGFQFFLTTVQIDEMNSCKDEEKRKKLNIFTIAIKPELVSTESTILGVSRLGYAKLGDGVIFNEIEGGKEKMKKDALIAETAIKNQMILLTNDKKLRNILLTSGAKAMDIEEFKILLRSSSPSESRR